MGDRSRALWQLVQSVGKTPWDMYHSGRFLDRGQTDSRDRQLWAGKLGQVGCVEHGHVKVPTVDRRGSC